ncbi:homocysteine S-methyltransferase 3-like [Ctenocephalides felis]|uniref:homocysteine S-methyltransferase 3-like n=1 Tax=Ctenocephalides felis TaxID=7515 RepID=UPI000E6E2C06|nr:homocysteine S-methyltransferase 3-like [Ctenocephalides felis]
MAFNNGDLCKIMVLDGGFSTQLAKYVGLGIDSDPLWSARYNSTRPSDVRQAHLDYLRAGADIISTNTYQVSIKGYMEHLGLTHQESIDLINSAIKLAFEAQELYKKESLSHGESKGKMPIIMGSVGPYGAHLHDGSEYSGTYAKTITKEELQAWHRPQIEVLLNAGVDGLAIETIPCQIEAEAVIDLIINEHPGTKAWLSFQCKNELSLASGESFREAALSCWKKALATNTLVAIGANCVHPKYVSGLFKYLNHDQKSKIPLVVYPNSSEEYTPNEGWTRKEQCPPIQDFLTSWIDLGVKFIGGCCRTDDEVIRNIRKAVDSINRS